jgi:EAL domain-containing protein (putative c-di-GMP-specific phosphodiesterase class I)
VVTAICQLAKALHMTVVAEGVETEEHAAAAQAAGCHELQGYLFSKPLPQEVAATWLRNKHLPTS